MNARKITAIIWFLGLLSFVFISSQLLYSIWLMLGCITMYIETGIDTNWYIEKRIINFFRRNK